MEGDPGGDAVHPSDRAMPSEPGRGERSRRPVALVAGIAGAVAVVGLVAAGGPGMLLLLVYVGVVGSAVGVNLWRWWTRRALAAGSERRARSATVGPWLADATVVEDGICFPGRPPRRTCELTLGPDGATLTAGWTSATLPWDRFGPLPGGAATDPALATAADGWWLGPWTSGRNGPAGAAVHVAGQEVARTAPVRRLRGGLRNRLARMAEDGVAVPLVPSALADLHIDVELVLVQRLCQLLATRPELRPRLADGARAARLLSDLRRRPLGDVTGAAPITRRPFEVVSALTRLGYTHRQGGRPLPDQVLPPLDEIVGRVVSALRTSPYTRDLDIGEDLVAATVRQRYLVEPWPFAALFDGP